MKHHEEEWMALSRQAVIEQDPYNMKQLTRRIIELLIEKQSRLDAEAALKRKLQKPES
jgi:hypothetical protein